MPPSRSRPGVSNTRPAGRMRPSKQFYAARNNLPKMPKFCEFRAIGPQFSLFSTQFTVDAESVPVELQMEVVDFQCDTILKQKYTEIGIPDFYKFLSRAHFPKLVDAAARIMSMFGST